MVRTRSTLVFAYLWAVLGFTSLLSAASAASLQPPVAKKDPHTTQIHGDTLADDYYWLRNKGTPDVEAHLKAELAYAEALMKPMEALQQKLYDEMLARIQQTDVDVPFLERGFYYYTRTEEGKQYPIHCRKKGSLEAPEEVILDVNQLAEGKPFMSVGWRTVSPDGNLLAYHTDETGFRQFTLHVKDLRTGQLGPEAIPRVTSFEWAEDGKTLIYGVEHPQTKRSYQVFRHVLGEAKDGLLYEEKDERFDVYVNKSRDRQVLFIQSASHTTSEVRYLPAGRPTAELKLIAAREQDHQYDVDHRPGEFWIRTNDNGRNFRLVVADEKDPSRAKWREVVPHRENVMLDGMDLFQDFYVVLERESGILHMNVTERASGKSHRIEFPEPAYIAFPIANREFDTKLYRFAYQSPVVPNASYDYDPVRRERKLLKQTEVLGGYDPSRYRVELTQATAPDGVKIPMWLLYRKDLQKDGKNPVLLSAYGSYGAPGAANFNPNIFSLVDRGVIFSTAYIRGGGEMGKKWHDDGRMMKKKNTFTDFIAAAEHLIAREVHEQGPAGHRRRQRGRPADGRGGQHAPRPLQGGALVRAVRGRDQHHAGRDAAAHRRRVRGVGQSQDRSRVPLHEELQPLRQPGGQGLPDHARQEQLQRLAGDVLGAREVRGQAAGLEDGHQPARLPHQHGSGRSRRQERALRPPARDGVRLRVSALAARSGEGAIRA